MSIAEIYDVLVGKALARGDKKKAEDYRFRAATIRWSAANLPRRR